MTDMTTGSAALVGLVRRYLEGLLDPFISLLEVQKLMYFMQEAGEPLRLKYQKVSFGPYAENLRPVLKAVEGNLLSGYADGGDVSNVSLQLTPGAVDDASRFLRQHPDTLVRFDQVSDLVEGFESAFGLELLSTVHWVIKKESASTLEQVIRCTYGWNERKRQFTERQIALALEVLTAKGWVSGF